VIGVRKIVIPVDDEILAKTFWTERLAFDVVCDQQYGEGQRWLEVSPPDRSIVLVLSKRHPQERRPAVPDQLPHSPVFFSTPDIHKTYDELTTRGVTFAAPPVKMAFGWWSMFEDHEGTRYALGQW
jgi:lactoylglutathione lyase